MATVSLSKPRCFKSLTKAAAGWSTSWVCPRICLVGFHVGPILDGKAGQKELLFLKACAINCYERMFLFSSHLYRKDQLHAEAHLSGQLIQVRLFAYDMPSVLGDTGIDFKSPESIFWPIDSLYRRACYDAISEIPLGFERWSTGSPAGEFHSLVFGGKKPLPHDGHKVPEHYLLWKSWQHNRVNSC